MTADQLTNYLIANELVIQRAKKFGDLDAIHIIRAYHLWRAQPSDYRYLELLTATASFRRRQENR